MNVIENLPSTKGMTKKEILNILLEEEYGSLPEKPISTTTETLSINERFCAGKADLITIKLTCKTKNGDFSFPVYYARPKNKTNIPCFIHINFRNNIPDEYQPTEEIIDAGYATLTFCYKDVTSDDDDFKNGLAGIIYPNGKRKDNDCGKIGLWAWAAIRVMDYAQNLRELDKEKICVVGHSRLGKTALLAGAADERFFCAFSSGSGCSGAALARQNTGESIESITYVFPFWFSENYRKYAGNEQKMPFDQHFLIAANYPHHVYVSSADEDLWACPKNEFLSCTAADEFYRENGKTGFVAPNKFPETGECFHDGSIGYHMRKGLHYLSREDWKMYIDFLKLK